MSADEAAKPESPDLNNCLLHHVQQIAELAKEGLEMDVHHKQWYLGEILRIIDPIAYHQYRDYIKEGKAP